MHSAALDRNVFVALHPSLPHSFMIYIYIASSLIRINAGALGGKLIDQMAPTPGTWRET